MQTQTPKYNFEIVEKFDIFWSQPTGVILPEISNEMGHGLWTI